MHRAERVRNSEGFGRAHRLAMLEEGSFVRFLIESRGKAQFMKVFNGGTFRDVYGVGFCALEAAWVAHLVKLDPRIKPFAAKREPCKV